MNKTYIFSAFIIAALAVMSTGISFSNSSGATARTSGAPGENTCAAAGCHSGTPNSGNGTLSIELSKDGNTVSEVEANETYTVLVSLDDMMSKAGFQLSAKFDDDSQAGSFSSLGDLQTIPSNGIVYVTHTSNATSVSNNSTSWTFEWTAPATDGNVNFYAAGNAANGNGNTSGDNIYTTSAAYNLLVGIGENSEIAHYKVYPNPANDLLFFEKPPKSLDVSIFNLNGELVLKKVLNPNDNNLNISELKSGLYLLQVKHGEDRFTQRIAVQ